MPPCSSRSGAVSRANAGSTHHNRDFLSGRYCNVVGPAKATTATTSAVAFSPAATTATYSGAADGEYPHQARSIRRHRVRPREPLQNSPSNYGEGA